MTKAQGQKRRAYGMVPLAGPQSARMHSGIGSALKPAYEPIVCARKPLSEKNLVQNILQHGDWLGDGTVYKPGTGGLNIDASRVGHNDDLSRYDRSKTSAMGYQGVNEPTLTPSHPSGRFPSNTLWSHVPGGCVRVGSRRVKQGGGNRPTKPEHGELKNDIYGTFNDRGSPIQYADPDGLEEVAAWECVESCPVKALDEQSGQLASGKPAGKRNAKSNMLSPRPGEYELTGYGDKGGASRFFVNFSSDPNPGFFYCAKSSKRDRTANGTVENVHPTCKPTELMRYLLRLVTPENGTTLDPFAGSGTSGVAALSEGFNAILIEAEPEYAEIAERRCAHALSGREEEFSGRLPL